MGNMMANTLSNDVYQQVSPANELLSIKHSKHASETSHNYNYGYKLNNGKDRQLESIVADTSEEEESRGGKKCLNCALNFNLFYFSNQFPESLIQRKGTKLDFAKLERNTDSLCLLFQVFRI
ncbi:hypothetical protein DNU06_13840 [Putridiphycobacter roseus]|uniref:Uncharacterized protein n=2 Tax=Putridiphycobacter roseus TaxID=2219161 RepID=A0A2W1NA81_9FLAO|nr:hypothetical protein DNU06_13840 [Putridiphycobacter roseus]